MHSDAVLARLERLHPKLIDLSLDRIARLLAALDHPERRLPPVIHVAGTNGKGSVIAFLKAMCEAAGLTAHVYTSPHLVRFHERIAVAGTPIAEDALAALLEECESANAGVPITFFEITTAAAYLAFARAPADVALIETGLGGRFDATNVIGRPRLCAITPVAVDHTHFLGETVAAIAFEKAGILKPGVAGVVGRQSSAAAAVIAERAAAIGAPLFRADHEWRLEDAIYTDAAGSLAIPAPGLHGPHQVENAALALACARRPPGFGIGDAAAARGLAAASWPGRLQRLEAGPVAARLPAGWEAWLDGGHNVAAAEALAAAARDWRDAPLHLVVGVMDNRDAAAFLAPLAAVAAAVHGVAIPGTDGAQAPDTVAAAARGLGLDGHPAASIEAAVDDIVATARRPGRILICGSLYLAGAVLSMSADDPWYKP